MKPIQQYSLCIKMILLMVISSHATEINVATADNSDMLRMRELSDHFQQQNPGITLQWHFMDESVLRLALSRDSKRETPRYDVYTIGLLEAPTWGESGRLSVVPPATMDRIEADGDTLTSILDGFYDGESHYGLPFYGESSMTYYRKDIMNQYGIRISTTPTWSEIKSVLSELTTASNQRYGRICLRGKPGWGENMALVGTMVNAFGGRWFNEQWEPQLESSEWSTAIHFYLDLQKDYGIEGSWRNGYSENLRAFSGGQCEIWVDSTAAASALSGAPFFADIDYRPAPIQVTDRGSSWLWSWGFSVPNNSIRKEQAWRFVEWATSRTYHRLVEQEYGIVQVPPGTRRSLYLNPDYTDVAPFAEATLTAIEKSDIANSSIQPIPYRGIQFVQSTEFQQIGDHVGKKISETLQRHVTGQPFNLEKTLSDANAFAQSAYNVAEYLRERGIDAF